MEPNYTFPILVAFDFESYVDLEDLLLLKEKKWHHNIGYSMIYLATVLFLRLFMKDRKPFDLRFHLLLWNLAMTFVCTFGTVRTMPGYLHMVFDHSYAFSLCDQSYGTKIQPSVFWGHAFSWIKLLEFGDTMFLVLRKRKLRFLHCYHHALTAVIAEYGAANRLPSIHGCAVANCLIHSLMYGYYTLTTLKLRIPKIFSMTLTSLQIIQMVFGLTQCYYALYYRAHRDDCHFPLIPIMWVIFMYSSYFVLFFHFFYYRYIVKTEKSKMN